MLNFLVNVEAFPDTTELVFLQASLMVSASDLDIFSGLTTYFIKYK